ncbi:MAG: flavin reductase [Idiomarina sp.]|nr:flavin reductase [Idiomarina sp.]
MSTNDSIVKFTSADFAALPSRFRARLVNSLSGFKSANLIGTTSPNGILNLAMVSSVVHLGASPALVGMVMRPRVNGMAPRDTLVNIENTGVYTINHVSAAMLPAAHDASANFSSETCEFEATGLTPFWPHKEGPYKEGPHKEEPNNQGPDNSAFAAPSVAESPLQIGLKLVEIVPFKANGTEFVIGEIVWVRFAEHALKGDGYVAIEDLGSLAISGLDGYHSTSLLDRFSYAEPEQTSTPLPKEGTTGEKVVDIRQFRESVSNKDSAEHDT